MGLDNGIILRTTKKLNIPEGYGIEYTHDLYEQYYNFEDKEWEIKATRFEHKYSFGYWRKCWNIRNLVRSISMYFVEDGDTPLFKEDIDDLIIELYRKNDPDVWGEDYESGETIWSVEEMHIMKPDDRNSYIYNDMRKLAILAQMLDLLDDEPNGAYQCYFYDSY